MATTTLLCAFSYAIVSLVNPVGASWQRGTGGCNAVDEEGVVFVEGNEAPTAHPRIGAAVGHTIKFCISL